ncbi:MAG: phage replisome organizer N-terminal domain-containing protein [Clostridium sp.]|nr:phage replisome organizer N-terminal domain-containing protein [Clostridium sp.]
MAKAKWIKMDVYMFRHPKLLIIDSMEDSNMIYYVWTSSVLLAGECNMNGCLYISEDMPYTLKTLAIVFRRSEDEVKKAYDVLMNLGMMEKTDDEIYKIRNWEKHQNVEGLEKIRKQTNERVTRFREKKREEKMQAEENKRADECEDKGLADKCFDDKSSGDKCFDDKSSDEINEECSECGGENNETHCNVSETHQNKRENKKQIKNKKKSKDTEKENQSLSQVIGQKSDISGASIELLKYCERITGIVSPLEIAALNLAVDMHGRDNVKKAMDKAIANGRINISYINGILRNWRKEGYPEDDDIRKIVKDKNIQGRGKGVRSYGKNSNVKGDGENCIKSKNIRTKEPPKLTDEQRRKICEDLI